MKFLPCLIVLLFATATASAEPDATKLSVGGGVELVRDAAGGDYGGLALEGSYRLGDSPLFARAQLTRGIRFGDSDLSYDYLQARLGLEYRHRLGVDWLHAYGGLEVGFARLDATDVMTQVIADTTLAIVVVPRAGIQIGNRIYGRLGVEVPVYLPESGSDIGFAVTSAVGASF